MNRTFISSNKQNYVLEIKNCQIVETNYTFCNRIYDKIIYKYIESDILYIVRLLKNNILIEVYLEYGRKISTIKTPMYNNICSIMRLNNKFYLLCAAKNCVYVKSINDSGIVKTEANAYRYDPYDYLAMKKNICEYYFVLTDNNKLIVLIKGEKIMRFFVINEGEFTVLGDVTRIRLSDCIKNVRDYTEKIIPTIVFEYKNVLHMIINNEYYIINLDDKEIKFQEKINDNKFNIFDLKENCLNAYTNDFTKKSTMLFNKTKPGITRISSFCDIKIE